MVDPSVPAHINKALSATNASIPASPGKMLHSMLKNIAPTLIIKSKTQTKPTTAMQTDHLHVCMYICDCTCKNQPYAHKLLF